MGTTYDFERMTQAQASAFGFEDEVAITRPGATPAEVTVSYAGNHVTITYDGHALTFDVAFLGRVRSIFSSDRLSALIGTPGNDVIVGYSNFTAVPFGGGFSLIAGPGDAIYGGAGDDTISGAGNLDLIFGGPGSDLFVFPGAASGNVVADFERGDHLALPSGPVSEADYSEFTAASMNQGAVFSIQQINAGLKNVMAYQFGPDVFVYADIFGTNVVNFSLTLRNTDLSAIDASSFVSLSMVLPSALPATPAPSGGNGEPVLGAPPVALGPVGAIGVVTGNQDSFQLAPFSTPSATSATNTTLALQAANTSLRLDGVNFAYSSGEIVGATALVNHLTFTSGGVTLDLALPGAPAALLDHHLAAGAANEATNDILGGNDRLSGAPGGVDLIRGLGGADTISGAGGADSLFGGAGNDVIYAEAAPGVTSAAGGSTYLRGEDGDDYIIGGGGFDDANGNMGNDTISTGEGDDYAVGGKDNDLLFGDGGNDIVWGNLGDDTLSGGAGKDQVRGGQGDDLIHGGEGDDFMSGDRGADTEVGGAGADTFHGSQDAGIDRVLDFRVVDGDRVQLDPGTTYSVSQVGADTVINMGGGNQMILVGVSMSSLTAGSIFLG